MPDLDVAAAPVRKSEGGLSRKALLTFLNRLLQEFSKIAVMFFVRPIIIGTLGAKLFGAWMIIQQVANYMVIGDLNPTKALRISLSVRQHVDDYQEKRRYIGAALLVWVGSLPVVLILGFVIVWFTPSMIKSMSTDDLWAVKVAIVIFVVSVGLTRVLAIPGNVLRGVNMEYKAMGLEAGVAVVGGVLSVAAVMNGYNLPGLAFSHLIVILLGAALYYLVAKGTIPWFGIEWPARDELFKFVKISGWVFVSNLGWMLIHSTNLIVLGITLDTEAVAVYATTLTLFAVVGRFMEQIIVSTTPGISGLCGEKNWPRLIMARDDIHEIIIGIMAVFGCLVLALNESFLEIWIGKNFYAGDLANFLFVLIAIELSLYRVGMMTLEGMLLFRPTVVGPFATGIIGIVSGYVFSSYWGLAGMAAASFLSRLLLVIYFSVLVNNQIQRPLKEYFMPMVRPAIVAAVLMGGGYYLSLIHHPDTWFSFILTAAILMIIASGGMWAFGFKKRSRDLLHKRFSGFFHGFYLQKKIG